MTEDRNEIRDCLLSIMYECEGYRFGQDSYDIKLDHIYETASVALEDYGTGLSLTDQALVSHMCRTYEQSDEPTRARLRQINVTQLAESRRTRVQALAMLAAADRVIAMREALIA